MYLVSTNNISNIINSLFPNNIIKENVLGAHKLKKFFKLYLYLSKSSCLMFSSPIAKPFSAANLK